MLISNTGQEQSILDGSLSVMVASMKLFMLRLLLINVIKAFKKRNKMFFGQNFLVIIISYTFNYIL